MIKIFIEDLRWNGKLLVFTWHFKDEFDRLKKQIEFVLDILDGGEHILVSKRKQKYNVFYAFHHKYLCLSYVIVDESIVLIHIKPTGKSGRNAGK
ncbi:MAG: hypothetical protein HYU02_01620 [Thaumarchaeota archaeon]|nr:hypothetical protein [Nitrososphaerota archaeon]